MWRKPEAPGWDFVLPGDHVWCRQVKITNLFSATLHLSLTATPVRYSISLVEKRKQRDWV